MINYYNIKEDWIKNVKYRGNATDIIKGVKTDPNIID